MNAACLRCGDPVSGRRSDAKYCNAKCRDAARGARHRIRHADRVRAQWRRYFYTERGTLTALFSNARDRAKKADVPFALTEEWLLPKLRAGVCELSGLPFERLHRNEHGSRAHPFAPSLDRVIPGLGYVEHNVRLVCFVVNQARSDFGDEVLFQIAEALTNQRGRIKATPVLESTTA